jgi:N-acetylneuraminate lyase
MGGIAAMAICYNCTIGCQLPMADRRYLGYDLRMQLRLSGLIAAPFTPFTADGGIDLPGIDRLCAHLVRQGVGGAFVCGTTGEGVAMTVAERLQVAERWLACAPRAFPVIVHAGALALGDARALAAHAERHRAAAVAVLAPCFLKPAGAAEVVDWIAAVASACPATPVTYYHIPSLTGVAVAVHEVVERAVQRVPNFAGIKFTFEDLHDYGRCVAAYGDRLSIAFGRDEMLLPALAIGATAAVGSTYNIAAPLYLRTIAAFARGDLAAARASQQQACAMIEVLKRHRALPAMKALLAMQGVPCGACRLPLRTLDAAEQAALRRDLEALPIANDLFATWIAS